MNDNDNLLSWLDYIEQQHPQTIDLSLERVQVLAKRLELNTLSAQTVLIAGTNGKGTTAHIAENYLIAAGISVAVYSSPHLFDYRERARVNGQLFTSAEHCAAFDIIEEAREDVALTYFEFTTLAMLWLFKKKEPDVLLLEVGLGGRLDATNVVEPELSVITTIDLDHQDWLGETKEAIGAEKAGIFRPGKFALVGDDQPPQSVLDHAQKLQCDLILNQQDYHFQTEEECWHWQGRLYQFKALPYGNFHTANAALAIMLLETLGIELEYSLLHQSLLSFQLAGRWQQINRRPTCYVDVAHNPQATQALAQRLIEVRDHYRQIVAVVGMNQDKAITDSLQHLLPIVDRWYAASLPAPRGASAEMLQSALQPHPTQIFDDITQATEAAFDEMHNKDLLIGFGSFITVAAVTEYFQGD